MTKTPYFDKNGKKKGAWSKEEDDKLIAYIERYGHWNWSKIPKFAGVSRCGKSCRLRWMNYLRPNMKRGNITKEEEDSIIELHAKFGNKWSTIATKLPGRSDNEIKNYWNTNLKKQAKSKEKLIGDQIEYASSSGSSSVNTNGHTYVTTSKSPQSTSLSPPVSTTRMESLSSSDNDFDTSVTCSNFISSFGFEDAGCFWTNPLLVDVDSAPRDEYSTSFNLAQASSPDMLTVDEFFHDMFMDDEFLWSTMNLYDDYHRQLQK